MKVFQLDHPIDEIILCDNEGFNKQGCKDVADYLEIDDQGHESKSCERHKNSDKRASQLPKRQPSPELPYSSRPRYG